MSNENFNGETELENEPAFSQKKKSSRKYLRGEI